MCIVNSIKKDNSYNQYKISFAGIIQDSVIYASTGGPAEKCGQLKVKDQILTVNGDDLTNMRHSEAWHHLKFLDDGDVHLTIRRLIQQEPVEV